MDYHDEQDRPRYIWFRQNEKSRALIVASDKGSDYEVYITRQPEQNSKYSIVPIHRLTFVEKCLEDNDPKGMKLNGLLEIASRRGLDVLLIRDLTINKSNIADIITEAIKRN